MSEFLLELGIDLESLQWQDLALCKDAETNMFYDWYESDPQIPAMVDEMCSSCPVQSQCLRRGVEGGEYGVWGGVYLNGGKADEQRNAHKSQADWQAIGEAI